LHTTEQMSETGFIDIVHAADADVSERTVQGDWEKARLLRGRLRKDQDARAQPLP
jgi:hypothetical protein